MHFAKRAALATLATLRMLSDFGCVISFLYFLRAVYPFVFTSVLNCFIWFFLCYGTCRLCIWALGKFGGPSYVKDSEWLIE